MRTLAAALSGLAVVLLVVVQFTPWASYHLDGGSFTFPGGAISGSDSDIDAKTWEVKYSSNGGSDTSSWYDSDNNDADGIGQIRAAIPILLVGLVAGLAAMIVGLTVKGVVGPILALVAGLVTAAGIVLFAMGISSMWDGLDYQWVAAFYLAIAAAAALVIGGVLGLASGNRSGA